MATEVNEPKSEEGAGAEQALMQMLSGAWVTQAVATAARLGIPDALASGPKTPEEIAATAGARCRRATKRLMRALAGLGVFAPAEGGRYGLTELGERLREDFPGSLKHMFIAETDDAALAVVGEGRRRRPHGTAPAAGRVRHARLRLLREEREGRRAVRPRDGERLGLRRARRPRGLRLRRDPDPRGRRRRQRQHGAGGPRASIPGCAGSSSTCPTSRSRRTSSIHGGGRRRPVPLRGRGLLRGRAEGRRRAPPEVHPARLERRGLDRGS